MPLFAVAGSQGTGKSTVLAALKERGYTIIERKTSRSILNDWNIPLEEINKNPELTTKFQEEISKRKLEDELAAAYSDRITFTERTHADLYTYALFAMGKFNDYSQWLDYYFDSCKNNNLNTYSHTFYLPHGLFDIVHDGVRACNARYARIIDAAMRDFTVEMLGERKDKITFIETRDIESRIAVIEATVNTK